VINVCHVAPADGRAGADVQLALLLRALSNRPGLEVSAVLFNDGRLADTLNQAGIPTQIIPESRHSASSILRQLIAYCRSRRVDILHTHKGKDNVVGAMARGAGVVRRQVRTVHGACEPFTGFKAAKANVVRSLDAAANRWIVDRVVAVSRELADALCRSCGEHKVVCVRNGIDVDEVRPSRPAAAVRRELGLGDRDVVVGTMGRLTPVKGLDSFLAAARLIRDRRDVKFLIVGDGPLRDALRARARALDLDGSVMFAGHRDDSHDVLAAMDVFALPSLHEGMPIVLLEALALERPVVAMRVGGIPEVVEDGRTGLLVAPGDAAALAQRCLALVEKPDDARRLAQAGARDVRERFSVDRTAAEVADVYRALMQPAPSVRRDAALVVAERSR